MREPGANFRTNCGGMLADSAGEDEHIQSAERGCQRANGFSDLIAEHLDRHRRIGVGRARVEQVFTSELSPETPSKPDFRFTSSPSRVAS